MWLTVVFSVGWKIEKERQWAAVTTSKTIKKYTHSLMRFISFAIHNHILMNRYTMPCHFISDSLAHRWVCWVRAIDSFPYMFIWIKFTIENRGAFIVLAFTQFAAWILRSFFVVFASMNSTPSLCGTRQWDNLLLPNNIKRYVLSVIMMHLPQLDVVLKAIVKLSILHVLHTLLRTLYFQIKALECASASAHIL